MRPSIHAALALVVSALWACGPTPPPKEAGHADDLGPGPIRPPDALDYDFQWRQQVTATWPTGTRSFEAVLMKRDGALTMLGLSPMGVPGFTLTLDADAAVHVDNRTGQQLPFEPAYILADIERVFFPWLSGDPPSGDAERQGLSHGMRVHERFRGGKLVERDFVRDDAPERGRVRVRYEGWAEGQDAPTRVELDSEWFGYALTIETLEQSRL